MGKLIDYKDYINSRQFTQVTEKTLAFVRVLHPKIEAVVENEIAKMTTIMEEYDILKKDRILRTSLDETIITSLCFILSNYLIDLATRPNNFNVTNENLDVFIENIIQGMIKTFKKTEI